MVPRYHAFTAPQAGAASPAILGYSPSHASRFALAAHPLSRRLRGDRDLFVDGRADEGAVDRDRRSEEHTSELQSLMRISYAVFCLKNKKTKPTSTTATTKYRQAAITAHTIRKHHKL